MNFVSTSESPKVVCLSFRQVKFSRKKRRYAMAEGEAVLELQLLGDRHSLTDAAELLFQSYLGNILNESLNDHIWRFTPIEDECLQLSSDIPLLSREMKADEPYEAFSGEVYKKRLQQGFEMLFYYDEGSTTRLHVTVTSVDPLSSLDLATTDVFQFPRIKGDDATRSLLVAEIEESDDVADTDITNTLDAAFPFIAAATMSTRHSGAFFGLPAKPVCGAIEGGPHDNGDQLFTPLPFDSLQDYLIIRGQTHFASMHKCFAAANIALAEVDHLPSSEIREILGEAVQLA
jgi:hypothetical protein